MLRGFFDESTGAGMLRASVYLPRIRASGEVDFLVDTGADAVSLSPLWAESMGLDLSTLELNATAFGAGGRFQEFREPAMLSFVAAEGTYLYLATVSIPRPEGGESPPSLLGREILNRWAMAYDPMNRRLEFDVHASDRFEPA